MKVNEIARFTRGSILSGDYDGLIHYFIVILAKYDNEGSDETSGTEQWFSGKNIYLPANKYFTEILLFSFRTRSGVKKKC